MYFVDPYFSKSLSGGRFFSSIANGLSNYPSFSKKKYKYVLINISSPIIRFIFYRLLNKRIIIRVDGNYSYPITKGSLRASSKIAYWIIKILYKVFFLQPVLRKISNNNKIRFIFNLRFNYSNYIRIFLSQLVVYQSSFSRASHKNIFHNKKSHIIRNSSPWGFNNLPLRKYKKTIYTNKNSIFICTSFHKNRPLKGFGDLLLDLETIKNTNKSIDIDLFIFGYIPETYIKTFSRSIINFDKFKTDNKSWISTYPKFSHYSKELSQKLINSDIYITYAQLDPCPNIVLEALAHGLPVIGCDSGGIPEIIGNCGEILPISGKNKSNYKNLNFECGLEPPNREDLYKSILRIINNKNLYQKNIENSLRRTISIESSVDAYHELLNNLSLSNKL